MRLIYLLSLISLLSFTPLAMQEMADQCPPHLRTEDPSWQRKMRRKTLENFDRFLNWTASEKIRHYSLNEPPVEMLLEINNPELSQFSKLYGYFSPKRPIVAKVTKSKEDLIIVSCLLRQLHSSLVSNELLELATFELIAKALAYRDLQQGDAIEIPIISREGKRMLVSFTVDVIFDLWHGMPAFGLLPSMKEVPALLLFRGTDFSLGSERGLASMLSDLDMSGPGLSAFLNAQKKIHAWLLKVSHRGNKARAVGFSLGGALASYAFIYENELMSDQSSIAFNPPGASEKICELFLTLPSKRQHALITYVNDGDIVSKVGCLFGSTYQFSTEQTHRPLYAHTLLITGQKSVTCALVDVEKENESR
jgi:hypothetical protein